MKRIKISTVLLISILAIRLNTIQIYALDENKYNNIDYLERVTYLEDEINILKDDIDNINKDIKKAEEDLTKCNLELKDIESRYNVQMSKQQLSTNNDNLKLFDIALQSDTIGDFFKYLDIMKQLKVNENKLIKELEKKSNEVVIKGETIYKDYTKLNNDKANKDLELVKLQVKLKELETLMERRGDKKIHFNPNNLLEVSNLSVADVQKMLEGTALYEVAPAYIEAENEFGVNALFIIALSAEESGWGTSKRAIQDNNLTGFGAYGPTAKGINANTKRENILITAKALKNNYLIESGPYFNGYAIKDVNKRYCFDLQGNIDYKWSEKIENIAQNLYKKLN